MFNEYFKILGIEPTNSIKEIKIAYKKQLFLWHPDRTKINGKTDKSQANIQTSKVITAYNFLNENIKLGVSLENKSIYTNIYGDPIFRKKVSNFTDTNNIDWNIRKNVKSSNIEWVEYHIIFKILIVRFKKSGAYLYKNVPQNIMAGFEIAQSKGKYFGKNICGAFICHKIDNYSEWQNHTV